ncbi:hypothetical protein PMAYCL1PPCAC_14473, partial [Pristionchus mayeri]
MYIFRSQSPGSSIMISGPIATLYNANGQPVNFTLLVRNDGPWSSVITPGASTTFLSSAFLDVGESYNVVYLNEYARSRIYDFGRETDITFHPVVGNYYPDDGDSVTFSCTKADGKTTAYNCGEIAGTVQRDTCKSIALKVVTREQHGVLGPRFMVQIEST